MRVSQWLKQSSISGERLRILLLVQNSLWLLRFESSGRKPVPSPTVS
jgi:hypothetical protein